MKLYSTYNEIMEELNRLKKLRQKDQPFLLVWEIESRPGGGVKHEGMVFVSMVTFTEEGKPVPRIQTINGDGFELLVKVENIRELWVHDKQ